MYPGTPGILRRNGVGRYILLHVLHVYTILIYPRIIPGFPVYPGTPGILRRSGVGQYPLTNTSCALAYYAQAYRIVRVSRDSWDTQTQWGWTIYILLLHVYTIPIYPRIVPGLPVYPGTPGILRRNGGGRYILLLHVYTIPIHPRITRVSRDSWDTQTQWGWTIYILLLHVYTIPIYPRIVPGLPVYPGTPGILRHSGVGRYTLTSCVCYSDIIRQDRPCILGLLRYSDAVGLMITLTSCTLVYTPGLSQDRPCIPGLLGYSDKVGLDNNTLHVPWYVTPIYARIVPGSPCILGLLRYSDAVGLD